jgi:uncharacterized repeat protein (TIGR02543 family)
LAAAAAAAFALALALTLAGCPTPDAAEDAPPAIFTGAVKETISDGGTTATINFLSTRAGTYYIVVYPAAAAAPESGAQIESGYGLADLKASAAASAGVNTAGLSGLSTGAAYKAHVMVKDAAGIYSNVWSSVTFRPTQASYLITYHLNGGAGAAHTSYTGAQLPFTLPTAPTVNRTGYVFSGWYDNSGLSGSAVMRVMAGDTGNKEFWAKWTAGTCWVTFNPNGGGMPSPAFIQVTYGGAYGALAAVSRADYGFMGWYTAASGGTKVSESTIVNITEDQTLYAQWAENTYIVTYHLNGGSGAFYDVYISTHLPFTLPVPVRTGYTFGGWYGSSGMSGNAVTEIAAGSTGPREFWAKWTANQYTVTFNANGGETPSPVSMRVAYGETYGALAAVSRTGYGFAGWYTAASGGTEVTESTTVSITADQMLYARWALNIITYHLNDGSEAFYDFYISTQMPVTLLVPVRTGYAFGGWYGSSDLSGNAVTEIAAGSTGPREFWAKWLPQYTVTFNGNGGDGTPSPASKIVTYGETYGALAAASRAGCGLAGWYTAASGGTKVSESTIVNLTEDQTLYAHWMENTYAITYHLNGGSGVSNSMYTVESAAVTLPAPVRTGYTFGGWYGSSGLSGNAVTQIAAGSTGNKEFWAKWTANQYTVTFNANGGGTPGVASKAVTYGASYGALATVSRTGYAFAGWYTAASGGAGVSESTIVNITADQTLYARWTRNTYTVYYAPDPSTISPAQDTVTYGLSYTLALPNARTGYTFAGWYTGAGGTGTQLTSASGTSLAPWAIDSNPTVYAWWTGNLYTVTFNANGGEGTPSLTSKQVIYGAAYGTLAAVSRTGYTFAGWYTAASGGTEVTESTTVGITAAQTLYAHWTAKVYTVTFNTNCVPMVSVYPASRQVTYGSIYGAVPVPQPRTGYTCTGWYTEAVGGTEVTASTVVTIVGDHTLYAHWMLNTYTITYYLNGGSGASDSTYTVESAAVTLPVPARTGYVFGGWYGSSSLIGNAVTQIAAGSSGNKEFWAKWTANQYTVTFNANGGDGTPSPASKSVTYGAAYGDLATVSRTGCAFTGWYTAASGGTEVTASTVVALAEDHTLYARWTAGVYTLTYDYEGATGGNSAASAAVTYGASYTLAVPTKTGYTFGGWWTGDNGTGTQLTSSSGASLANWMGTAGITVYARWTAVTYTLTYDYEGATGGNSATSATVTYNASYTLAVPTKTGYTFGGWWTGDNGTGTQLTSSAGASLANWTGTANATVYARWTAITYSIAYSGNENTGGSAPSSQTKTYGTSLTLAAQGTLVKTGHTFGGWNTAADGSGTTYAAGSSLSADLSTTADATVTLYAKWTAATYTLTYDYEGATGGNSASSATVTYGSSYTLAVPTKTGYTFEGWYDGDNGTGNQLTYSSGASLENWTGTVGITVYARWTLPDPYRVMVSITGGVIPGSGSNGVFISDRTVTLSSYKIAKYETTYNLWSDVKTWAASHGYTFANAGQAGRNGGAGTEPVTTISWWDAIVWCNAYSEKEGKTPVYTVDGATFKNATTTPTLDTLDITRSGYRLPTEAEWEAAARGGNPSNTTNWGYTYAGSSEIDGVAWYNGNADTTTHVVGQKTANLAGLYDMSGNVQEWCWDWYGTISPGAVVNPGPSGAPSGTYRVVRGGAWGTGSEFCAVFYRRYYGSTIANNTIGFRVVCPP